MQSEKTQKCKQKHNGRKKQRAFFLVKKWNEIFPEYVQKNEFSKIG